MVIRGRSAYSKSNRILSLPQLPYPLINGKIQWNDSFDSQASGSIEYTNVNDGDRQRIFDAYNDGDKITLYGMKFEVTARGYTRQKAKFGRGLAETFAVTITLREEQPEEPETESTTPKNPFSDKKEWVFSDIEVIADGANTLGMLEQGYNNAVLTFDQEEEEKGNIPGETFSLVEPVIVTRDEGDRTLTTAPPNTFVLRDFSSNFDESGPKKVLKSVTRLNGKVMRETIRTYGFQYLAEDINAGDGILYYTPASDFWREIDYRQNIYTYAPVGATSLNIRVLVPGISGLKRINFIVHPDYARFANIGVTNDGTVSFQSNARYLISQITTGWRSLRLKKETENRNTLDPQDPYYPYWQFRKVPFYGGVFYALQSTRRVYGDDVESVPFRIEFTDYASLPDRLKQRVQSNFDLTQDGKVAVLYPEPNYVEPLFIESEYSYSSSFVWAFDPEAEADPDQFIPGTNRRASRPRLTSGEESYTIVNRQIVNSNQFTEYVTEYSSQDPGFDNSAERYSFREMDGQPPEADSIVQEYESRERRDRRTNSVGNPVYYISTENAERFPEGGTVNVPGVYSATAAVEALEWELRKANMQVSQAQKTVTWFFPEIRGGDAVKVGGDRFSNEGTWRVNSVSWVLEYKGLSVDGDRPLVTCPGTQLNLGLDKPQPISLSTGNAPSTDQAFDDPEIRISVVGSPDGLAANVPVLAGRRNF